MASCPELSAITIADWGVWELHNLSDVGFSWKQLSISTLPLPLRERERERERETARERGQEVGAQQMQNLGEHEGFASLPFHSGRPLHFLGLP